MLISSVSIGNIVDAGRVVGETLGHAPPFAIALPSDSSMARPFLLHLSEYAPDPVLLWFLTSALGTFFCPRFHDATPCSRFAAFQLHSQVEEAEFPEGSVVLAREGVWC